MHQACGIKLEGFSLCISQLLCTREILTNESFSLGVASWISSSLKRLLIPRKNSGVDYFYTFFVLVHISDSVATCLSFAPTES